MHQVQLKNQRNKVFYDKLTYLYIELPKFNKTESELESKFDKWLYVFRHLSRLQDRPAALQERVFKKLFQAAAIAKFSRKERTSYEDSLKHYCDLKTVVDSSKEEGLEEGIDIGARNRNLQVAKNLKKEGIPIAIIIKCTELAER